MAATLTEIVNAVKALAESISGVDGVVLGVPASIGYTLTAFVTVAGGPSSAVVSRQEGKEMGVLVTFAYRSGTQAAAALAELALAEAEDAFHTAWLLDRTFGGRLETPTYDTSLAREPQYASFTGSEYRMFPVLITGRRRKNY